MALVVPLPVEKVEAANQLYERLDQWRLADQALWLLADRCPGFAPEACVLKVVAVNALYGTNVYATTRMAKYVANVLAGADLGTAGAELVERLAALPPSEGQKRERRHISFASKFAHFFVDDDRFPIMDSHALRMLKQHLGRGFSENPSHPYVEFVSNLQQLKRLSGVTRSNRELDRYLWLAGAYASWKKKLTVSINAEARALFAQPSDEVAALLDVLS
ncbi:MAG: hypothetical protein HYS13_11910 [Planctomycetia bacterium]|nr:hypothetical protein [Planctomycetia bacterium]